jgi:DNA-binding XRE family transcriptional regulator
MRKKEDEITLKDFIPFEKLLAKQLKNKEFKEAYFEELSRLNLVHEIKTLRVQKRMTQAQVAAKAKMPQSVIARIESGSRGFSIATLHKIASVFDREVGLVAPRR